MASFDEVAALIAAAADSVHVGPIVQQADELRAALGFLQQAGDPAVQEFGAQIHHVASILDEAAHLAHQLQDALMAASQRVAQGGPVAG
jgi:hypothetical protein